MLDDRDEYQRNEIYEELAFSGILLWFLTTLLMVSNHVINGYQFCYGCISKFAIVYNNSTDHY